MSLYLCFILLGLSAIIAQLQAERGDDDSSDVQALLKRIEDLEKREQKNAEKNQEQQLQINQLTKQLNGENHSFKQRQLDNETPVAFYGKMTNTATITNQVLEFNTIITNIGNAYQRNTGRIVVPVSGIYVFSLTAMAEHFTDTHLGIFVNDKPMTNLKLNGPEHEYDTMSQTAVYYLHQFDNVSVQHHEGNKTLHSDYTAFTAFLLQQDYGQIATNIIG